MTTSPRRIALVGESRRITVLATALDPRQVTASQVPLAGLFDATVSGDFAAVIGDPDTPDHAALAAARRSGRLPQPLLAVLAAGAEPAGPWRIGDDGIADFAFALDRLDELYGWLRANTGPDLVALRLGGIGTFAVDLVADTTTWDAGLERVYGRRWDPSGGASTERFLQHVHPDDHARIAADIAAAIAVGRSCKNEFRYLRGDGTTIWLSASLVPELAADGRTARLHGAVVDITHLKRNERLRSEQAAVLERIAAGAPLRETLTRLVRAVESQDPTVRAAILVVDDDGEQLRCGAVARLSPEFAAHIDGLRIGPKNGSCGAAVFHGRPIHVADTETDPLFDEFREHCRRFEIRSSWSQPILDSQRRVIGTFSLYGRTPGVPDPEQTRLIEAVTHTASICIERHRSEAALHKMLVRLDLALASARMGVFEWECDHGETRWSSECAAILGMPELGRDTPWEQVVHADDRHIVTAAIDAAVATDTDFHFECRARGATERWLAFAGRRCHRIESGVRILVGTVVDITARRRDELALRASEEQARQLVEVAIDAVITIDERGVVRQWNSGAERMFQWPRDEAIGRGLAELVVPPDQRAEFAAALATPWPRADTVVGRRTERLACRRDGSTFLVELSVAVLELGQRTLYHAFVRDLTERQRADALRTSLEKQLRDAQKMQAIGTLAGGIAHDFNNILAAILGNVETMLLAAEAQPSDRDRLRAVQAAATRGAVLVRQILTFSRDRPPDRRTLRLEAVVDDAVTLLRASAPPGIEIVVSAAPGCPPIAGDAAQLHQVLMNLCTNAWLAYGGAPGRVDIELAPLDLAEPLRAGAATLPPRRYLTLTVTDGGRGMTQEVMERMFEPFFTTRPNEQGTGLGLAVVHGIVTAHEGAITVTSGPGVGTAIRLYFPAVAAEPTVTIPQVAPLSLGRGQRVLYVDDEQILAELAARALDRLNYTPRTFTSATAALAAFAAAPDEFDVVVTDHSMPDLSGLEFAAAVRSRRPDVPIVLSSGYLSPELGAAATQLDIHWFLTKPNTIRDLADVLRRALSGDAVPQDRTLS